MEIIPTHHAKERMEQRKIFWREIIDAVKYPDKIVKNENKSPFQKSWSVEL